MASLLWQSWRHLSKIVLWSSSRNFCLSSVTPLEETLRQLNETNAALRRHIADRDDKIQKLEDRVAELEVKNDDLEQQGRKRSIPIFGLPEHGDGPLEQKLLELCNEHLKLQPPICAEYIKVAHRLGKPPPKPQLNEDGATPQMLMLRLRLLLATPVFLRSLFPGQS